MFSSWISSSLQTRSRTQRLRFPEGSHPIWGRAQEFEDRRVPARKRRQAGPRNSPAPLAASSNRWCRTRTSVAWSPPSDRHQSMPTRARWRASRSCRCSSRPRQCSLRCLRTPRAAQPRSCPRVGWTCHDRERHVQSPALKSILARARSRARAHPPHQVDACAWTPC